MKWVDLEREFYQFLVKRLPGSPDDTTFLLAVSGGLDSMVLLHLFNKSMLNFEIAHCNFGLRGEESDGDEAFILKTAEKYNNQCFVRRFKISPDNTDNKSVQMAARDLRYEWFGELIRSKNIHFLATAHHADDNLETILFNLTRGTGIKGLAGIPEFENFIVRPMLSFTKAAIREYAEKHKIEYREDSSNQLLKYKRNQFRLEVIPKLKSINPRVTETVTEHIPLYNDLKEMLLEQTRQFREQFCTHRGGLFVIDQKKLLETPGRLNILSELLSEYGFSYKQILFLIEGKLTQTGTKVESSTHHLYLHNDQWIVVQVTDKFEPVYIADIPEMVHTSLGEFHFTHSKVRIEPASKNQIVLDLNVFKTPFIIRTRKDGDSFCPEGMNGRKQKLKNYFINEKYSIPDKDRQLLLLNEEQILWVVGKRYDHKVLQTGQQSDNWLLISFADQ